MQFLCYAVLSLMAWQSWTPDWTHYFKENTSCAAQVSRHQLSQSLLRQSGFPREHLWFWQHTLRAWLCHAVGRARGWLSSALSLEPARARVLPPAPCPFLQSRALSPAWQ